MQGEMHIFVGQGVNLSQSRIWEESELVSGIGYGSGKVRFQPELIDATTNGLAVSTHDGAMPLFIHESEPPASFQATAKYIAEPTIFFSVLWSNLFRTIYAGVAAWYTLIEYKLFFSEHYRMVLMDRKPRPIQFLHVLQSVTTHQILWLDDIEDSIYRAAVIGLTREVFVAERNLEDNENGRFTQRNRAFRLFCDALKTHILKHDTTHFPAHHLLDPHWLLGGVQPMALIRRKQPQVTFVLREGQTRLVINELELINALKRLPITLNIYRFNELVLGEQIKVISDTDVFISMHGAALTHVLFLKPGAYLFELFPYKFEKHIFKNLAAVAGVGYVKWQNSRLSATRFNWNHVESNKFTEMPDSRIKALPIDWFVYSFLMIIKSIRLNIDSKNYWRNQDTVVSVPEVVHTFQRILDDKLSTNSKFLMFMPWEQLGNQIIGFKSACALASMLDRVLVLPHLGYRVSKSQHQRTRFSAYDYEWTPFETYFDLESLLSLPCRIITQEVFLELNRGRSVGSLRYHHLGDSTSEDQLRDYYGGTLKLRYDNVEWDVGVYYQLTDAKLLSLHGKDQSRVLALGSMFWYYDFGLQQEYPLVHFYDFFNTSSLYRQITEGLRVTERRGMAAKTALRRLRLDSEGYVAVHIRRGDYKIKCDDLVRNIKNATLGTTLYDSCFTPTSHLRRRLVEYFGSHLSKMAIFIATNANETERDEFTGLASMGWRRVIYQSDVLFDEDWPLYPPDPNERVLVDQEMCVHALGFIGNLHSSISRGIVESRTLKGQQSFFF
ncbi:hypothetical protein HK101_011398 [Irineochytrium annulatum]|nr:hypothetical protein HK101_011398 [Irineochytrium annulatum]